MIPILFDTGETEFASNGLGRLADCISCTVTEERNGIYECEFTYPVTGEMYPEIQEGRILGVIHDDAHDIQPFDIYSRTAPLNGVVTFFAHHVSYRLGKIVLKPMTASSCAATLAAIPNNTYTECPFTFWTDKSVSATWTNEVPNPVKAILGGQQGSILDVYGKGEYEWDNWAVKLYVNRGNDNGVSIRYGVNLTDLTHDIDISGVYTAVVPFWKSPEGDTVVTLDGGYVKVSTDPLLVSWTDNNDNEMTDNNGTVIEFNAEDSGTHIKSTTLDLSEAFKEQPTQEQLRAEALRRLTNSEAWLPNENIKVSFVDLSHTEEYKSVAALQRVKLCDRVSVYCGPLGVSAVSMQVIRVVFNTLTERYDEIELGAAKTSFAQAVAAQVEEVTKDLPTVSMMQNAINNATDKITGAKGGHVRFVYDANGDPQEILIMDTEDIETAVNVWRWNSGGLGFSSNGYAGPYALAMTADGQIVADMITTGELSADLITAGHLSADLIQGGTIDGEHVNAKLLQIINEYNAVIATFGDDITLGSMANKAIITRRGLSLEDNAPYQTEKTYFWAGWSSVTSNDPYYSIGRRFEGSEIGRYSCAVGYGNAATEYCCYAEGLLTTASMNCAHAEGSHTTASGYFAHAEGEYTVASERGSHAEGMYTIANHRAQHVFGWCNVEDATTGTNYLVEIVGNGHGVDGTTLVRSNARTLDRSGNEWIAGTLTQASDSRLKEESGQVPDLSSIRARRFRWNDKKVNHDNSDHIGYFAQDVEKVAPYLVDEDASGYKSLDYIALLCAKVEMLERRVAELEKGAK